MIDTNYIIITISHMCIILKIFRFYKGTVKSYDPINRKHVVGCAILPFLSLISFDSWRLTKPIICCLTPGKVPYIFSTILIYKILYDDGDVEVLKLEKERWEVIDSDHKTSKVCEL